MRASHIVVFVLPVVILVSMWTSIARAQGAHGYMMDRLRAEAAAHPDLKFSSEGKKLRFYSGLDNSVFRPDGAGPFPAIVLVHTCGGIGEHSGYWTQEFLKHGFAVLVVDSLGPRGVTDVCAGPFAGRVGAGRGVKDAFDALVHLRKLGFVDTKRIGLVGTSWGAIMGLLISSKALADAFSPGQRFGAVVSMYPDCVLRDDIDRPLLVLMGAADTDTPPAACVPALQALKERGAPVEWHLYPTTTHAWDRRELHNFRRTNWQGWSTVYLYSKEATEDSGRRIVDFMERRLGK